MTDDDHDSDDIGYNCGHPIHVPLSCFLYT